MKDISILIPQGHTSLTNIEGSLQLFSEVNNLYYQQGKAPLFNIRLVGTAFETKQRNGLFTINPNALIEDVEQTDLIIIPAMFGDFSSTMKLNEAFIPWIVKQYRQGAEIASFCVAAFFLAETGLLKNKKCATHWQFAHEFRMRFPDALLVDDKIMTEDKGIYTSGGAYSYLNLLLYLVEKYAGRDTAIIISKMFMIDIDRNSQSPFIMFKGQKEHHDELIRKAQEFIESNFQEKITVDQLADILALGRRSLERRFKKATSNTISEYIQRVKIEAAKKGLERGNKTINELMYEVGYSDTKAFRTTFKKITGLSPIAYRNKYHKDLI